MKLIIAIAIIVFVIWFFTRKKSSVYNSDCQTHCTTSPQAGNDWEKTWQPSAPIKASGKCGQTVNWILYEDGQLIIEGSGEMYDYDAETFDNAKLPPWYPYRLFLRSVKIRKGVTKVGRFAFNVCKNLTTAALPCTIHTLSQNAFGSCEMLREITLSCGITRIPANCFIDCVSLQSVIIPYGVTEIADNAFYNCRTLANVILPATLTDINSYAFAFCPMLTHIQIPRSTAYIDKYAFHKSGVNI